jgi:hypothetical protein
MNKLLILYFSSFILAITLIAIIAYKFVAIAYNINPIATIYILIILIFIILIIILLGVGLE